MDLTKKLFYDSIVFPRKIDHVQENGGSIYR